MGKGCCSVRVLKAPGTHAVDSRLRRVSAGVTRTPPQGMALPAVACAGAGPALSPCPSALAGPDPSLGLWGFPSPVLPLNQEDGITPRLFPEVPTPWPYFSIPSGCLHGVLGWKRRGLRMPNWAVWWGSATLGLGHQDVPVPVHPRATAVHIQGCVQELTPWNGSGPQECPGTTAQPGALWATP